MKIFCLPGQTKMAGALNFLLVACLLQGALCEKFEAFIPKNIKVLSGSCVTIPCSFDIKAEHESNLDNTCKAVWRNYQNTVVFDSRRNGVLIGDLKKKDCTTTLNNMKPDYSNTYFFRVECDNKLKNDFHQTLYISVNADPPSPTLTPSTLKVKEGDSVSLSCSAPAPCLSHPPTLTWTPGLGGSQETLQDNQDQTKVKISNVTFTASHLHHKKNISCTAVYSKQDGSTESSVSPSLTADISCALCEKFEAFIPKNIKALSGSCVTIPCSFDIKAEHESNLDNTCKAVWINDQNTVVFDSTRNGVLIGDLKKKDCTTTLNNMKPDYSNTYFFRVECNILKYSFAEQKLYISVNADPPSPTLTPSTLKVKEGDSVSLSCSAPAPCLSHPPTLTWTPGLGGSQETLQDNQDQTKVKISNVTFTASHLHHKKNISCTAVYSKQDGSTESSVSPSLTADISYSPKHITVSVNPSGPVPEGRNVSLTCISNANPAVRNYTWYRADGGQETFFGTGAVLNIKVAKEDSSFFCKAENDIGVGRSNSIQIDVQFAPQILPSSTCSKAAAQLNCSCMTVGNPSATLQWYLDGLPVNHSDKFVISNNTLNDKNLISIITVNQPQDWNRSTLLCRSSNSLGSASQQFCVNSTKPQTSTQDRLMLPVFITTVVALLLLVCSLLCVIRAQKTQHNLQKSQCTGDTSTVNMSQLLTSGEGNEVPNTTEEDIYVNTNALRQADVPTPATISVPNSANLPNSGPNNAQGDSRSLKKQNEEGNNVIYSSVNWEIRSKKKGEYDVDTHQPGSAYLEEERCMVGDMCRDFVDNALYMGSLYDNVKPRNVEKESEYAQVKYKNRGVMHK
ncbi:cell adhesion molecule CEACAM5-like [Sander vitreus]